MLPTLKNKRKEKKRKKKNKDKILSHNMYIYSKFNKYNSRKRQKTRKEEAFNGRLYPIDTRAGTCFATRETYFLFSQLQWAAMKKGHSISQFERSNFILLFKN